MKYKIGDKVRVTKPYSGGNFDDGDIVTIECIGCDDDDNCYGAISPYDNMMWYLNEDEVRAVTNGDRILHMSYEELADDRVVEICGISYRTIWVALDVPDRKFLSKEAAMKVELEYLQQPVEDE